MCQQKNTYFIVHSYRFKKYVISCLYGFLDLHINILYYNNLCCTKVLWFISINQVVTITYCLDILHNSCTYTYIY